MNHIVVVLSLGVSISANTLVGQITELKLVAADAGEMHYFGSSVDIDGDYAIIGAPGAGSGGAAYIFKRHGDQWIQEVKITASDGEPGDSFGDPVSISGEYAAVGVWGNDTLKGSVYVFKREGVKWTEEANLTAGDRASGDFFGLSIAVSHSDIIVGAPSKDGAMGAAYVFRYDNSVWVEEAKITAGDGTTGDQFGQSVGISGDHAIIGANEDDGSAGSAYIFRRENATWSEDTKLTASDRAAIDAFGFSVAISADFAVVGAPNDDNYSGSAYVFEREAVGWIEDAKLLASDGADGDEFGRSVSIAGNHVIVGASVHNNLAGSAYLYAQSKTNWMEENQLNPSDGHSFQGFGYAVSISGGHAIVGAPFDGEEGLLAGAAYVYSDLTKTGVLLTAVLFPDSGDGTFEYTMEFTNSTDTSQTVDIWTELVDPHGARKEGKVMIGRTLKTHRLYQESGTSALKENASFGDYVFVVNAGTYPDSLIATTSATYTLTSQRKEDPSLTGAAPGPFRLLQNYPDPFNPSTTIRYDLSEDAEVTIKVYNMLGQLVTTLVDDMQPAGQKSVVWNGTNDAGTGVSSGNYVLRMTAGTFVETKRMLLIR